MPRHLRQRDAKGQPQHRVRDVARDEPRPDRQVGRIKTHDRRHVEAAERDGRGLHADAQVVVAVDHGVFGVVGQHPEQVAEHQPPRLQRHAALHRRVGHRNAEAEGHAQHRLRHRDHALGVGIDQRDGQRRKRPGNGGGVGGQHQAEGDERQHGAHGQRFLHADEPAGHRALRGALDVAVELAVGHVVDAAAGRAHQDGAEREHHHQMPARKAARRQPQRAE